MPYPKRCPKCKEQKIKCYGYRLYIKFHNKWLPCGWLYTRCKRIFLDIPDNAKGNIREFYQQPQSQPIPTDTP